MNTCRRCMMQRCNRNGLLLSDLSRRYNQIKKVNANQSRVSTFAVCTRFSDEGRRWPTKRMARERASPPMHVRRSYVFVGRRPTERYTYTRVCSVVEFTGLLELEITRTWCLETAFVAGLCTTDLCLSGDLAFAKTAKVHWLRSICRRALRSAIERHTGDIVGIHFV